MPEMQIDLDRMYNVKVVLTGGSVLSYRWTGKVAKDFIASTLSFGANFRYDAEDQRIMIRGGHISMWDVTEAEERIPRRVHGHP